MENNIFDIVINYLSDDISKIYNELSNLNLEISNIQEFLDNFLKHNSEYLFSKEMYDSLNLKDSYDKFSEAIMILDRVDYNKLKGEPQIQEILSNFSNIERKLYQLIEDKIRKYDNLKKDYLDKKSAYLQYIKLLNGDLESVIEENVKNDFFNFLHNSSIDIKYIDYLVNYLSNRKIIHANPKLGDELDSKKEVVSINEQDKDKNHDKLPTLSLETIEKIETYKEEFESLSEKEKNGIISASSLLLQDGDNNNYLEEIARGFTKQEILYYSAIYTLLKLYNSYNDLFNEKNLQEASQNAESYEILSIYLNDVVNNITDNLQKIVNIEEEVTDKEFSDEREIHNIILFLDDEISSKNGEKYDDSVCNIDIDYINKKDGGEAEKEIKQIIRLLNTRFIGMSSDKFRGLGSRLNKPLSNLYNSHYNEFDSFNVRVAKGSVNNSARIPYITLPLSENNRRFLCEKYSLPKDACIYLILGILTKNNDDSEYVHITHNRLTRNHEKILEIERIFEHDFDDLTNLKARKLIDRNLSMLDDLNKSYKNINVK